jgi:hypothetical protein
MTSLNKKFYLGSQIGLFVATLVVVVIVKAVERGPLPSGSIFSQAELVQFRTELIAEGILLILFSIAGAVIYLSLVYKMWASIQDGNARMSPGKAIGFLFIPLFQVFWFFQVWWGFSKDYNNYRRRHSLQILLAWIPFLGLAGLIADWILFLVIVSSVCDAVNALAAAASFARIETGLDVLGQQRYPRSLSLYCVSGEFGGNQLRIPSEGIVIGRNPSRANLILGSDEVSGSHVRVWPDLSGSGLWAEDMHSTNGTYYSENAQVGGRRRWIELRGRKLLGHGAHFRVGSDVAEFEVRLL